MDGYGIGAPNDYAALRQKKQHQEAAVEVLTRPAGTFVTQANPYVLNHRLSIQQGVFLCPGDVTETWVDNLSALGWSANLDASRNWVLRMDPVVVFEELARMNVTARSLFPGIDGYAKSLRHRAKLLIDLELPEGELD